MLLESEPLAGNVSVKAPRARALRQHEALEHISEKYSSLNAENAAYHMEGVREQLVNLTALTEGTYLRPTLYGTSVHVTRKTDRATIAAQKVRMLGETLTEAVAQGTVQYAEAEQVQQPSHALLLSSSSDVPNADTRTDYQEYRHDSQDTKQQNFQLTEASTKLFLFPV